MICKIKLFVLPSFLSFLILLPAFCQAFPSALETRLSRLLGSNDAALIVNPAGQTVFAHRADAAMIPASTLKIVTSLVAFDVLGQDYRFVTEFYIDDKNNLYIKGYGDPMLLSEDLRSIATTLAKDIRRINHIFLDATHFTSPITIPGAVRNSLQPYDAGIGALCVNFNTVNFRRIAGGKVETAEPQTPLVPFILDRIKRSGMKEDRISLSTQNDEHVLYAGHLFAYFLKQEGIRTSGEVLLEPVPAGNVRRIYSHRSTHFLEDIVTGLLAYSNNFIANQLLITCGIKISEPPGSLAKGVESANRFMGKYIQGNNFAMVEGSGISRGNRISPRLMDQMLVLFTPYRRLMRHEGNEYYKTGTLSDVQTRVGYFEMPDGRLYRYAVMINTPGKPIRPVMKVLYEWINEVGSQREKVRSHATDND